MSNWRCNKNDLAAPRLGSHENLSRGSGYTPVDTSFPRFPIAGITDEDKLRLRYQRRNLYGFTTYELHDLDIITTRPLKPNNLPDQLYRLFGRVDIWEDDFAALLNDPLPTVDLGRIHPSDRNKPGMDELKVYKPTQGTEHDFQKVRIKIQGLVDYMESSLDFTLAFFDGIHHPVSGNKTQGVSHGMTDSVPGPFEYTRLYIWLDYALVIPLLRDDLRDAEKMGCEWFLANSLVHEMMYAFWMAENQRAYPDHQEGWEPYFEDEALAEPASLWKLCVQRDLDSKRYYTESRDMSTYPHEFLQFLEHYWQNLKPEQRSNCEFGWKLINNAIWDQCFWSTSCELRRFISEMIDTLDNITNSQNPAETEASLIKILDFIDGFNKRHIAAVKALLALEQASESLETTRRDNLLNAFMHQLIVLDCGRMLLWSLEQSSDVEELEAETRLIKNAISASQNDRHQDCMDCIQGLRNMTAETVFIDSIAIILESSLPPSLMAPNRLAVQLASQDLKTLKQAVTTLGNSFGIQSQKTGEILAKWLTSLTYWIDVAEYSMQN
ncbi:hypothetical protein N431DRAFT_467731 [Stipitochalara longipes BDJ]|nr:hypothetical protein N431DRAFT_467731 [Stipitochalara longipes BDJ]